MADLFAKVIKADGTTRDLGNLKPVVSHRVCAQLSAIHSSPSRGFVKDLGVISQRYVTTAFMSLVVDAMCGVWNSNPIYGFCYHAAGTGTTAEAKAQTALVTEVTALRASGTRTDGGVTFTSIGTITFADPYAITEHAIFNEDGDPTAGTMLDRSKFDAINVVATDSIQFTYVLTLVSDEPV